MSSPVTIFKVAARGDLTYLRQLLAPDAEVPVDFLNDWGVSALMCAAARGQEAAAALLLEHGARHDLQDAESGYTALHRAFYHCHLGVAALLVRAGANVEGLLDHEGLSPLALLQKRHGVTCPAVPRQPPSGDAFSWGQAGNVALVRAATCFPSVAFRRPAPMKS